VPSRDVHSSLFPPSWSGNGREIADPPDLDRTEGGLESVRERYRCRRAKLARNGADGPFNGEGPCIHRRGFFSGVHVMIIVCSDRGDMPVHVQSRMIAMSIGNSAVAFDEYVLFLEGLAKRVLERGPDVDDDYDIVAALDGQPSANLRRLVPLVERRATGAFFTSAHLREWIVRRKTSSYFAQANTVLDPACGAGDLLLASAQHLPASHDLGLMLREWGQRLHGYDLNPQFVRAARARLILRAATMPGVRPGKLPVPRLHQLFPNLHVGDGLTVLRAMPEHACVLLNPPYHRSQVPADCVWSKGTASEAAVFVDTCVTHTPAGTKLLAILPDVLRTGSRYAKWRSRIETKAIVESVDVYGRFDSATDVDVFALNLVVGPPAVAARAPWWPTSLTRGRRIGNDFDIRVGSVVPHRHPEVGPWRAFLTPSVLPRGGIYKAKAARRRRYRGSTYMPPFVAVRRTSAPSERKRAVGTIVVGDERVAVENHLLVLLPRTETLTDCRKLLRSLSQPETDLWLNARIRCRHLTVAALRDLPLWDSSNGS